MDQEFQLVLVVRQMTENAKSTLSWWTRTVILPVAPFPHLVLTGISSNGIRISINRVELHESEPGSNNWFPVIIARPIALKEKTLEELQERLGDAWRPAEEMFQMQVNDPDSPVQGGFVEKTRSCPETPASSQAVGPVATSIDQVIQRPASAV